MVLHITLTTVITCTSDTQIYFMDYCYTNMLHGYMDMIHEYTNIHWYTCIDYLCIFLLQVYSCQPITCLFPIPLLIFSLHDCFSLLILIYITGHECISLLILIFSLLEMSVVDTRCVELSVTWISATGATSRIPHLLYIVSRYRVSWYQQSSCPIIILLVPCTVLVLGILYNSNIMNITWG